VTLVHTGKHAGKCTTPSLTVKATERFLWITRILEVGRTVQASRLASLLCRKSTTFQYTLQVKHDNLSITKKSMQRRHNIVHDIYCV
jgi:hypothetical protein